MVVSVEVADVTPVTSRVAPLAIDAVVTLAAVAAEPVTVVVPAKYHWEGLSIDRCDILKSGLLTIDRGKISPTADGLLLDAETFGKAFGEWRSLCAHNRLQWHLVFQKWQGVVRTLKNFLGGSRWTPPPFPKDDDPGPLKRPNLQN